MNIQTNIKAYLAYATVCVLWGTTYLAIRIGVSHVPPFLFGGLRWLLSGIVFLIFLKIKGKHFPNKKELFHLAVIGLFLLGIGNGFLNFAEQWMPSGLSSLLVTTVPFWMVGMEMLTPRGPKLNLTVAAGLVLGLAGVTIIFSHDVKLLVNADYLSGILSIFVLVIFWSLGSVYSKYKKLNVDPLMGAAVQMFVGGVVQTITGLSLGEFSKFSFDTGSLIAFIYLFAIASLIGYSAYIYMITHLPLSFASTYAYINPVIALFLGWLVLNEKLNLLIFIGAAVILTGVVVVKKGVKLQLLSKTGKAVST